MSKKIFINNWDTYVSQALMAELRNDEPDAEGIAKTNEEEGMNLIYGTYITKDSSNKPDGVQKMLKRSKPLLAAKYIAGCDLIVYDIHSGNPEDALLALKALNKYIPVDEEGGGGEEKVLVLISSLMAWDATPRKFEKIIQPGTEDPDEIVQIVPKAGSEDGDANSQEGSEKGEEPEPEAEKEPSVKAPNSQIGSQEGSDQEEKVESEKEETESEEEEVKKKPIKRRLLNHAFTEQDYKTRQASEEYAIIKEVEDLVLNANRAGIKTYVVSAGVLYGKGEAIFNSHFKKAWLQNPERLPVVGEGKNYVPTIHVTDLARMVKKIFETKPERQYIFGIDNTQKQRQRRLIKAISEGIGTGLTESIDIPPFFEPVHPARTPLQLDLDWRKFLLLNIKAKPSTLFVMPKDELDEDGNPVPQEAGEDDFKWYCENGLAANIQLVKDEFCKERGLKPFKVAIVGKPFTGKSFYAKQLAEHYNVPHISAMSVLDDIENFDKDKREEYEHSTSEKKRLTDIRENRRVKQEKEDEETAKAKAIKDQAKRRRLRRKAEGSQYADSDVEGEGQGEDEDNIDRAEINNDDEGSQKAPEEAKGDDEGKTEPLDEKEMRYQQKLVQANLDDADTEDEYEPLAIRTKVHAFRAESGNKLSSEIMSEAFRWRLEQTDCQNRGYILDGYPKSFKQAQEVFEVTPVKPAKKMIKDPDNSDENAQIPEPSVEASMDEEGNPKPDKWAMQFQKHIYPNSVIYLRGEDQAIIRTQEAKATADQDKAAAEGKVCEVNVARISERIEEYAKSNDLNLFAIANNNEKLGRSDCAPLAFPLTRFFQQNKTECFEIDHDGNAFEMFEGMRVYIERNGRPYNYLSSVRSLNRKREDALEKEETNRDEETAASEADTATDAQKEKDRLVALQDGRMDSILCHMKDLKGMDKLNMRQFLMKAIIPVLTEGMIDVWRVQCTDPVDYLADYIFKKSNDLRAKEPQKQ